MTEQVRKADMQLEKIYSATDWRTWANLCSANQLRGKHDFMCCRVQREHWLWNQRKQQESFKCSALEKTYLFTPTYNWGHRITNQNSGLGKRNKKILCHLIVCDLILELQFSCKTFQMLVINPIIGFWEQWAGKVLGNPIRTTHYKTLTSYLKLQSRVDYFFHTLSLALEVSLKVSVLYSHFSICYEVRLYTFYFNILRLLKVLGNLIITISLF